MNNPVNHAAYWIMILKIYFSCPSNFNISITNELIFTPDFGVNTMPVEIGVITYRAGSKLMLLKKAAMCGVPKCRSKSAFVFQISLKITRRGFE